MTDEFTRRICAQITLRRSYPEAELERMDRKRRWMEAQDGKLTPEQQQEDEADKRRNARMLEQARNALED